MIKALIFDMDGVLVNSPPYIMKAFNILLKEYGIELNQEQRKKTLGLSLKDQVKEWQKNFNMPIIDPIEFSKKAFKIELSEMQQELQPNPIIIKLITEAKSKGIKIAIATSSTKDRAKTLLDLVGVSKYLDALVTMEDVENHKPNPDIFLKAAEMINVEPRKCIVFEDAKNGIDAANSANMISIALLTDFNSEEDFKGKANAIIKNFSEIDLQFLESIIKNELKP